MLAHTTPGRVVVLDEDPELAVGLPPDELEEARRQLVLPALTLEVG